MAMHPYAEGNVAAARKQMAKCIEALDAACKAPGTEAWRHIAMAMGHVTMARAQLDAAFELEDMAEGKEAAE